MKNLNWILIFSLFSFTFLTSCDDDDEPTVNTATFETNFSGLEDLGDDYAYEGWLIVDGNPVSAGIFEVDANGIASRTSFEVGADDLAAATTYVLTIEPSPDSDPAPSPVHILAGDFSGNSAALTVGHGAALATDFTAATGTYILATPTDMDDTNEASGVWWLDNSAATGPVAGLDLPELPEGWAYEGWAVIDGTPVSTGVFTSATGADGGANYSGTQAGPPFPGEDFLTNAPAGLDFPVDLTGKTVVISVEPVPDNSAAPFTLKPLVGAVSADAPVHAPLGMDNNAANTNPSGTVSK